MNLTFKPTLAWLAAASLALCSYSCQPEIAEDPKNDGTVTDLEGEIENEEKLQLEYILSVKVLKNFCEDCEAPGCEANCERQMTSMVVPQMNVVGTVRPIPCEPPPPGVYYSPYLIALGTEEFNELPQKLLELSGEISEINPEEIGEKNLQAISEQKIMSIGKFALCLPPPPPPPLFDELLSNFVLELSWEADDQTIGLLYKDGVLIAIAKPDNGKFDEERAYTTIPFHAIEEIEEIEGDYTYVVRFNQKNKEGEPVLTEIRVDNNIE